MDLIIGRSARFANLILRNTPCYISKVSTGPVRCLCQCNNKLQGAKVYESNIQWRIITGNNHFPANVILTRINFSDHLFYRCSNGYATAPSEKPNDACYEPPLEKKPSVFQKMKQMTKDYWHILIPVHVVTSIGWISIFYMAAKNGVDIIRILEAMNLSERYLDILRGSNAGHWAVAYALYKLFTPIRYTVTVGGTTMSIRWLNKWGYLKFKPRSTVKGTQSEECAVAHKEKYLKATFKNQQQTEPPKT
ncbi:protein FAM210A isoform X2 [Venturia canescens]|uniref:protein FAM210A isoform X2 n=1 Tax=Venturia canescens TaxID=32260 RepID=UPI001C9D2388|nr:protein FAM210A isoform X2 [Venturia canescens]